MDLVPMKLYTICICTVYHILLETHFECSTIDDMNLQYNVACFTKNK